MIASNPYHQEHCDDQLLITILSSFEENSNHKEVIEHIELCQQCQQRFDELAACRQDWTKARQALLKQDRNAPNDFESAKWDFALHYDETIAWTESMASQQLSLHRILSCSGESAVTMLNV